MEKTYKIAIEDLTDFLKEIKKIFRKDSVEVTITIKETEKDNTLPFKQGLKDLEEGRVITFPEDTFFEIYEKKIEDALHKIR